MVVDHVYKETYQIFLLYEHLFSVLYQDGSSIETRHRMQKVLDTPLLCRHPYTLDRKHHLLTWRHGCRPGGHHQVGDEDRLY